MESVLKSVGDMLELLVVASWSRQVSLWDQRTLSRAFSWASYCEQVFCRFHGHQVVRAAVEKQLQTRNHFLQNVFSDYTHVTFADLRRCRHLLLAGLLRNRDLPLTLVKTLFDETLAADAEQDQDLAGVCGRIIRSRSACEILRPLTDPTTGGGADAGVQGALLMDRMKVLRSSDDSQHFLDTILQGPEPERRCRVVAAALMTDAAEVLPEVLLERLEKDEVLPEVLLERLEKDEVLLERLEKDEVLLQHMSPPLLRRLARRHLGFGRAHLEVLKRWSRNLEYDLTAGEWVASTNPSVTFEKVTGNLQTLIDSCPSFRTSVIDELTALKVLDGGFEERGLSVWSDLLSELQRR